MTNPTNTLLKMLLALSVAISIFFAMQSMGQKNSIDDYLRKEKAHITLVNSMSAVVDSLQHESTRLQDSAHNATSQVDSLQKRVKQEQVVTAGQLREVRRLKGELEKSSTIQDSLNATVVIIEQQDTLINKQDSIITTQTIVINIQNTALTQMRAANLLERAAVDSLKRVIDLTPRLRSNPQRIIFNAIPLPSRTASYTLGVVTGVVGTVVVAGLVR
jgi:hypothetical protein